MILSSLDQAAASPFIFQLPATSGRRAIFCSKPFAKRLVAKLLRQRGVSRPVAPGKGRFSSKNGRLRRNVTLLIVRRLRPAGQPAYWPAPLRPATFQRWTHASRYPQSLRKLARPHRDGRGHVLARGQLCGLGHQRHLQWLRPLDAGQDRQHRDRDRRSSSRPTGTVSIRSATISASRCRRNEAAALGLDRQVLGEMVAQAGMDQRARQMGLGIPDSEIARHITTDPNLQTINGQFDRTKFEQILRNMGYDRAALCRRATADGAAPAAHRQL